MAKERKRTIEESESMLERLRIDRTDLTQDEFAAACGVSRATYWRWITGKTQPLLTIDQTKAICKLLGISIDELPTEFGPIHIKTLDAN